jgi:hypothetical protein
MTVSASSDSHMVRFGDFSADLHSGELRKHDVRVKLWAQPFQILQILGAGPSLIFYRLCYRD